VGVIGAGNMGKNHVRVYSELPQAELAAIADPDAKAKKLAGRFGCRYYADYREMLEKEGVEAVSIATPTTSHYEVAKSCLESGVHLLVEKPLAESVERAEKIVELAERAGVVLAVGHIERHNPVVKKLKEIVKKGVLGDINTVISKRVGIFPPQIKDANVYIDLAVHDIDVFNYLFSRIPERVFSKSGRVLTEDREDQAIILLDYGSATCITQVNWITPVKIRNLAITGNKGYAELDFINQELKVYESVINKSYDSFGEFVIKFGSPKMRNIDVEKAEPLKLELLDFLECVERGGEPLVKGEDGVTALKIALLAQRSAQEGKVISFGDNTT
jgi:UDP-N-acetylglucosamine 3-dehydrogenase